MRLYIPERIGCLGKIHKPAAQAQGRKNTAALGEDDFSAPEPEREAWPTGPGLSFPGQPAG